MILQRSVAAHRRHLHACLHVARKACFLVRDAGKLVCDGTSATHAAPFAETVLVALGVAVLVIVLVGLVLLRWRRTTRWHATIIAVLVVATPPIFALLLNWLWKAPAGEWRAVTTFPVVSGVGMLIVLAALGMASWLLGGDYQTTRKEALRAAGGAMLMLVIVAISTIFV